ncbi:hypothetical protein DFJ73DRAFT_817071 [Zopfochytrium polystomum]|nr:hypothetical protein DFJ73DRAFT_817071 [Zopfochytrium polystomum]
MLLARSSPRQIAAVVMRATAAPRQHNATARRFAASSPPPSSFATAPPAPVIVRKSGFVRGSILGFLLGLTLAGTATYGYLIDATQTSTHSLLASVEDLQKSTTAVQGYVKKIDALQAELERLRKAAVAREEVDKVRREVARAVDDVNVAQLNLKTEVWELAQELKALKSNA